MSPALAGGFLTIGPPEVPGLIFAVYVSLKPFPFSCSSVPLEEELTYRNCLKILTQLLWDLAVGLELAVLSPEGCLGCLNCLNCLSCKLSCLDCFKLFFSSRGEK